MKDEIDTMHSRGVWKLVDQPSNAKPVGCRWVYTVKRDENGKIVRFKARLVAQGYTQIKGESFDETFSPVINFSLIRFFFSLLVSLNGWNHTQCDIKGAYLYASLDKEVYMSQPPGFVKKGEESKVCKLDRAIYGLHQSGREWFFEMHRVLTGIGFTKFEGCNCAYMFKSDTVLILYVDDFVLFSRTSDVSKMVIDILSTHFDVKVLGKTRKLLGVEFEQYKGNVFMHQESYINEVADRYMQYKFPIASLPIAKGSVYSKSQCPKSEEELKEISQLPYRNILGCLSFIASRTRPDISYAVNIFSQFQSNPGIFHWNGLLKLLGYVFNTKSLKLKLSCNKAQLVVYSDADFASNRDDRTSVGGQLVMLDNSPIEWRTFKQKCVTLSTMESEFVAMTEATRELIWFDRILIECFEHNVILGKPIQSTLFVDNMATIDFVKSPIENCRSKHIDVKLFFVRDLVFKNAFNLKYVNSKLNLADIFTKPLTKFELEKFVSCIFGNCVC
ncbi:Retrovirus-related Pol polyprotein from transposon TNT 1-94 [Araneus ventricosus]|uniref:Retrovirus-related Pol polyprotein from transposon TNT 1-94 n=1 Tax=Araneus ventricosus TaxID=182803 RepID=A0A4Y2GWJ0_ARAVE|nr:Retrovirus-related Pol polyprotein from transposon TNT 1-94 [Araneus ventricosus]GBM56910.1 Retrovirus-related Pol polyprotein from transposon TNT 1-94 [Araneus ventricosus]